MSFSLRQIRYFVAAAETGQISRAAMELNVTQSAVTTAIRQLEILLGMTLLARSSTGVSLTPDGEQFLRHARDIMSTVDQALHLQRRESSELAGELRLGVTYTVAGYFLTPLLSRFRRVYPMIKVTLEEYPRNILVKAIKDGPLDLALGMVQDADIHDDLQVTTLHRSKRRVWLPVNHHLLEHNTLSLEQIAREPYIALTIDNAWENAQRYWDTVPFRPSVIFKTSSIEAVRTMVASSMGISILSDLIYRPWSLDSQRIETRDVDGIVPTVDVAVLSPTNRQLNPAARTLSLFLQRISDSAPGTL